MGGEKIRLTQETLEDMVILKAYLVLRHLGTGSGHRLAQHHDMIDEARLLPGSS